MTRLLDLPLLVRASLDGEIYLVLTSGLMLTMLHLTKRYVSYSYISLHCKNVMKIGTQFGSPSFLPTSMCWSYILGLHKLIIHRVVPDRSIDR